MGTPTLIHDCPNSNCGARHQSFIYMHGYVTEARNERVRLLLRDQQFTAAHTDYLIFRCARCESPVAVQMARSVSNASHGQALRLDAAFDSDSYKIVRIFPAPTRPEDLPEHVPEKVASPYNQACRTLHAKDYDLAGMGFRKTIDVATRQLIRELKPVPPNLDEVLGRTLYRRIEFLCEQGKITEQIKDWAHVVRVEGNDAAHEDDPFTKDDSVQIHAFTRVFLMYVFTMPKMVELYRTPPAA